jgi:hypothetical protein
MKNLVFVLILLHGAIHLMGFLKGFNIISIAGLSFDISPWQGLLWLLAFILFTAANITYLTQKSIWPVLTLIATTLSTALIVSRWHDAKFGMIPNLIILLVALAGFSSCSMKKMVATETEQILSTAKSIERRIITETDLNHLPLPVNRWLRDAGVVGKEEIQTVWLKQNALMKMKPEQNEWHSAEAEQYIVTPQPAFIWTVKMNMSPVIKIRGRDKFVDGRGEMLIRMNSLLNVVNENGERMDEGTLQRYLGEMVWLPTLALSPYITWDAIDDYSARATMTYNGVTGSGTFYFNQKGDFVKFVALRYMGNKPDAKRYPWTISVQDYQTFEGVRIPSVMEASWSLDDGEWTWLKLKIAEIKYNF